MEALGLTDTQAQAVLDTRLGNLARLEEMELKRRHEELTNEKQRLETLLSDEANLKAAIRQELLSIRDEYGDERRSPVAEPEALPEMEVSAKDLAPSEPVRVVLSRNGYLRAGKGHSLDVTSLQYKSNDGLLDFCDTETSREVTLLDNHGRVYCVSAGGLPSAKSYGEPVTKWLAPASGVEWVALLDPQMAQSWLMVGGEGFGFIATPGAFETRQRKGKAMLTADKAGVPYPPRAISVSDDVAVLTSLGRLLVMPATDLPELDKGKGVKLANLRSGETLVDVAVVSVGPGHGLEVRDGDKALARLSHEDVGLYRNKRAAAPKQVAELKNRSFERLCVVTGGE
jgi:topoisomerase-4 subunit A